MDLRPRKLDVYIVKKFITTFFVALILIIGIVIIFDISEKIDDFVSKEAPLKAIIFDYYVNFVPYFMNMFSPLFVFITVIFFTSKMASDSEIVAILSCGISFHRMMVPYIFSATLIAALSLCLNLFVIPEANKTRLDFENQYIKTRYKSVGRNVHYQISPGEFVFAESFSSWNNTAYRFTLEKIEDNVLVSKISAESAVYDTTSGRWKLKKYFIRDYKEDLSDAVRSGRQLDTLIDLSPKDFYLTEKTVETLTYNELNQLIDTQNMRGDANVKFALIEKNTRFALPFSAFILTIMGVALSSKKRRGGIGWNIGIGIALAFTYILFLRFSQMFVHTGALPPAIALWLPNVVFAIIAAFLYRIAPK
ncbi:MAG: LptF/LptG family permease [Bacteroidales bacterium]|nr:YjgP/YjgQ family permease [Bacteroidales bacterium]MBQ6688483.1 LptF/LptG family permease [Bacteroidales bacterium]